MNDGRRAGLWIRRDGYLPVVPLDNLVHDGQAQARAAASLRPRGIDPVEAVEQVGETLAGDRAALIVDAGRCP